MTAAVGVLGALVAGASIGRLLPWAGALTAVTLLVGTAAILRRTYRTDPHTPWPRARDLVAPGHAVVLWKPTCLYCESLLRTLRRDPRITWVNVWVDAEANAAVRALNGGNELTPTVLVGDEVLRNPAAARITERLDRATPR